MKVLELLDEIEEIIETSSGFPLTGKIMVDAEELKEMVEHYKTKERTSLKDKLAEKKEEVAKNEKKAP